MSAFLSSSVTLARQGYPKFFTPCLSHRIGFILFGRKPDAVHRVPNLNTGTGVPLCFTSFGRGMKPPPEGVVVYPGLAGASRKEKCGFDMPAFA